MAAGTFTFNARRTYFTHDCDSVWQHVNAPQAVAVLTSYIARHCSGVRNTRIRVNFGFWCSIDRRAHALNDIKVVRVFSDRYRRRSRGWNNNRGGNRTVPSWYLFVLFLTLRKTVRDNVLYAYIIFSVCRTFVRRIILFWISLKRLKRIWT